LSQPLVTPLDCACVAPIDSVGITSFGCAGAFTVGRRIFAALADGLVFSPPQTAPVILTVVWRILIALAGVNVIIGCAISALFGCAVTVTAGRTIFTARDFAGIAIIGCAIAGRRFIGWRFRKALDDLRTGRRWPVCEMLDALLVNPLVNLTGLKT